jgi:hypothetical protein
MYFVLIFYRFMTISTGIVYWYYTYLLKIDEEDFGGHGALLQEGLFASFTLFLVMIQFTVALTWMFLFLCLPKVQ